MNDLRYRKEISNKKGSLMNQIAADIIDYLSKNMA